MLKTLTALCVCMLLTACTPLLDRINGAIESVGEQTTPQALFAEGVDQLFSQGEPETLTLLQERFPASPWAQRAKSILSLSQQRNLLRRQLDQKSEQYTSETQRLREELELSQKRLEALRELTIELELNQP